MDWLTDWLSDWLIDWFMIIISWWFRIFAPLTVFFWVALLWAAQELPSSGRRNLVLLAVYQVQVQGKAIGLFFLFWVRSIWKNIVQWFCQDTKFKSCFVRFRKMGEILRNLENLNEEKSQQMFLKKCFESIDWQILRVPSLLLKAKNHPIPKLAIPNSSKNRKHHPENGPPNLEQQLHPNGGSFPGIHDRFLRNLVVCWHWIYRVGIPIRKFRRCEKGGWLISTPQTRSLGDELKLWYMEVPRFGSLNGMLG